MHVVMRKLQDDQNFVHYRFESDIWEPTGTFDQRGRPIQNSKEIYGYCKFNKKTGEFILDKEKTDEYFLKRPYDEITWVHLKLRRFMRENKEYPESYTIARG